MATWGSLTKHDRAAAIAAVEDGENPDQVASRYGLKVSSFRRTLRKLKVKAGKRDDKPPDRERITRTEYHNTATLESKSARIVTLEQLLEYCDVDLDIWRVDRYVINKWEVGAKEEHKDLSWTKGVIDGTVQAYGLMIHPLFQVKAWLVRRHPEALFPTIRPVESKWTLAELGKAVVRRPREKRALKRSLVFADPHFGFSRDIRTGVLTPFHDRRALDLVVQIAEAVQPDRVDVIGDIMDLAEWSDKFLRSPEFQMVTQPAVVVGHRYMARLRATVGPDAEITVFEGNHDARMRNAIITHLRAAYDLRSADEMDLPPALSVPKLLALPSLGIEWIGDYPDGEVLLNEGLRLSHGERAQSQGNTAKAIVNSSDLTEIVGHIHRIEWVSRTQHWRDGQRIIVGFCPGCVCHIDGRVPGRTSRQQWQQGLAVVDYQEDGRLYSVDPVIIDNGRAVWNGQLFEARSSNINKIKDGTETDIEIQDRPRHTQSIGREVH